MTDTGPASSGATGTESQEEQAPRYKSPTEQFLEKFPIFGPLFNAVSTAGQASSGSGEFRFSPEEVKALRDEFESEVDEIRTVLTDFTTMSINLQPLADDPASRSHLMATEDHFKVAHAAIMQQRKFAEDFVAALSAALDRKQQEDDAAAADFAKHTKEVST